MKIYSCEICGGSFGFASSFRHAKSGKLVTVGAPFPIRITCTGPHIV